MSCSNSWLRSTANEGITTLPPRDRSAFEFGLHRRATCFERVIDAVPVAVGAFADDVVVTRRCIGLRMKRFFFRPEIAREQHANRFIGIGNFDFSRRRSEQVAGIPETNPHALGGFKPLFIILGLQLLQRFGRLQRLCRSARPGGLRDDGSFWFDVPRCFLGCMPNRAA